MKVALAAPCFLEGQDQLGNDRLARNQRYIDYYLKLRDVLGFDEIFLFDNASSPERIEKLIAGEDDVKLLNFGERLERGPGPFDYPYCWRALYAYDILIANRYSKIITIDSDGFVLSRRMADFIRGCNSGWVSFQCETYDFPESSIHILNRDAFPLYQAYIGVPWPDRVGTRMESDLPFTEVNRDFRCGRFGEKGAPPQDATMDYYGQAPLTVPFEFGKYL